jgi:hypothetical protein
MPDINCSSEGPDGTSSAMSRRAIFLYVALCLSIVEYTSEDVCSTVLSVSHLRTPTSQSRRRDFGLIGRRDQSSHFCFMLGPYIFGLLLSHIKYFRKIEISARAAVRSN